ncbi:hypothetical protein NQ315_016704 [Exocentrus adspersus]|uniref:Endonuclease/exonuclease/phosphatase domain-containing protein n=1 Tax=Exocentrus adspersus TaxID=1586481 RepID=A0AAV8VEY9_9CUCU|nr:hypothetical protein NQ315_016704 [Exocentrus adspersus]
MAVWHQGYGVVNGTLRAPGDPLLYLALPLYAGLCRGGLPYPGTRGTYMNTKIIILAGGSCKEDSGIKIIQINLQHCIAVISLISQQLAAKQVDIALIQEPWVCRDSVKGLSRHWGHVYVSSNEQTPRTCIDTTKQVNATKLTHFCFRDLVAIKVTIGRRYYDLCSAYLPFESPNPPSRKLMELVEWCKNNNLPLIVGCDANAHHICWGSKDINQRGLDLLEFLNSSELDILNRDTKPTFVTRNRQEVIDITIRNSWSSHLVKKWHVSLEVSMSDHRHILFNLETDTVSEEREYRNPKLTVWSTYRDSLSRNVGPPVKPHTIPQIETSVENLTRAVVHAYEQSCPVRKARSRQGVPWWNPELLALRKKARALFNRAMRTKTDADWDSYKEAQRQLKSCIKHSKRNAWKEFCESIEDLPAASRIHRVLKKDQDCRIN